MQAKGVGNFSQELSELTTRCSQLKMTAADGKRYATDCFAQNDIIQLVRVIPSRKSTRIREMLRQALTDKIDDRETFMKGIDYSYYYEQEDNS